MADELRISSVPFPLTPSVAGTWSLDGPALVAAAGGRTDLFVDPGNGKATVSAPSLLGNAPAGDFQFSARVTVDFAATYDAGVLLLWVDEGGWAKLCFEYSPDGEGMVVSVVCRGLADDANAFVVTQPHVWLRVSRLGQAYAYHASVDGTTWQFIRHFAIDGEPRFGFGAQSPTGEGCRVRFDEIRWVPARLEQLRDGT